MIIKHIKKADGLGRVDKYILRLLPGLKPGLMHKQFRNKNILLNGHKISGNETVKEGDELKFFFSDDTFEAFSKGISDATTGSDPSDKYIKQGEHAVKMYKSDPDRVKVIYENAHMIILDKPSDMLSQKSDDGDLSLNEWLIGYLIQSGFLKPEDMMHFKPSVLNRLDRNTSGIVLGSKSLLGAGVISKALKERTLNKYYRTIVSGKYVDKDEIYIAYLSKNESTNTVNILTNSVSDDSFSSIPDNYSIIRTGISFVKSVNNSELGDISMLDIELITGKSHQIRAHLAALGYPILGDTKYGDSRINKKFKTLLTSPDHVSQFLHAYKVVFNDDTVRELELDKDTYICPLPESWDGLFSEN